VLGENNAEVWMMDADGGHPRNPTNAPSFDAWPNWSPDGKKLVFGSNRRNGNNFDIYVVNADGSDLRRITNAGRRARGRGAAQTACATVCNQGLLFRDSAPIHIS
jgi:Tol biopolymer transport system component